MIVTENHVSAALDYLSAEPHPAAKARHQLRLAEIARDKLFAQLFLKATGNVKERESSALIDPVYVAACKVVADCELVMEEYRGRTKAAEMVIEIFRTESANGRTAERIR